MSDLIKNLKAEYLRRQDFENKEREYMKTSVNFHVGQIAFLDAIAEHFETTRSDVVSQQIYHGIQQVINETDRAELCEILKIASKKYSGWDVTLMRVQDELGNSEGAE